MHKVKPRNITFFSVFKALALLSDHILSAVCLGKAIPTKQYLHKGPFINDVTQNRTFFDPLCPLCHTLSQIGRPPVKMMSQIDNIPPISILKIK